jgi:hypothetical protein
MLGLRVVFAAQTVIIIAVVAIGILDRWPQLRAISSFPSREGA